MLNLNILLDAYEILLLRQIIFIEFGDGSTEVTFPHFEKIAKNIQKATSLRSFGDSIIAKLFNKSTKETNRPKLKLMYLDAIIEYLNIDKVKSWEVFRAHKKYVFANNFNGKIRMEVPQTFPEVLNKEWQDRFIKAANSTLNKIYNGKKNISNFRIKSTGEIEEDVSDKLKKYFNTTWYAYFHFFDGDPFPQIIRSVLRIGDTSSSVTTEAPMNIKGLSNFEGSIKIDQNETTLIMDLVTIGTGERGIHLKVLVDTAQSIPEIALAEYSNIESGARGLHSFRVVFVYVNEEKSRQEKIFPKIIDSRDLDFDQLPKELIEYIHDGRDNCRITPSRTVLSFNELRKFIKYNKQFRFINKKIRRHKKFQVILSAPRYDLSEDQFSEYKTGLLEIKNTLESDFPFEINDYYFSKERANLTIPQPYEFYSDRIRDTEILLVFLFDQESDECLAELFWASDRGIKVHVFTTPDKSYVPKPLHETPHHIRIHNHFTNFSKAVEYFKMGAESLFTEEIKYFNDSGEGY